MRLTNTSGPSMKGRSSMMMHAARALARHQVPDLALLQRAHVQERQLRGKDVGDAVAVEEGQALVDQRALVHAFGERVELGAVEQRLEIPLVRIARQGLHQGRLPREQVPHDPDVEVLLHGRAPRPSGCRRPEAAPGPSVCA